MSPLLRRDRGEYMASAHRSVLPAGTSRDPDPADHTVDHPANPPRRCGRRRSSASQSDAPPSPPSDFLWPLVKAAPGESASASTVLGAGTHLIDAATIAAGEADHLWRVALIEVVAP